MPLGRLLRPLALLAAAGCASVHDYAHDRAHDLIDVVDLKYGRSMGLAAKVEATLFLGAGLGFAETGPTVEWFGRRAHRSEAGASFLHLLVFGLEGRSAHGGDLPTDAFHVLGVNAYAVGAAAAGERGFGHGRFQVPWTSAFRFGVEVAVPVVHGGLYLSLGEAVDFLAGLVTLDPAGDDDLPGGTASARDDGGATAPDG